MAGSISPNEAAQLVTVRTMLQQAIKSASAEAPLHHATAAVMLDAVVERVTHLVAVTRGVRVGRNDGLNDLISNVQNDFGADWQPKNLADIRQLHRARNAAQHEGLPPDRGQLPGWSAAVRSYVREIVVAQYDVELERVTLADSIQTMELRDLIRQAIGASEVGQFKNSVMASRAAFKSAFSKWQVLHRGHASPKPPERDVADRKTFDYLSKEIESLGRSVQASVFAPDLSEYQWFANIISLPEMITRDDAERAANFAYWWVIGYESASSTWIYHRRDRLDKENRLVRHDQGPASIDSLVSVEPSRWGGGWIWTFLLRDVPGENDYSEWARALESLLPSWMHPPEPGWRIHNNGTASIERVASSEVETRVMELREALCRADEVVERDRQLRESEGREKESKLVEYAESAKRPWPTWVSAITPQFGSGVEIRYLAISVSEEVKDARLTREEDSGWGASGGLLAAVLDRIRKDDRVQQCFTYDERIAIEPALSADDIADVLWQVDTFVQDELREGRRATAQQDSEKRMLEAALRTLISTSST